MKPLNRRAFSFFTLALFLAACSWAPPVANRSQSAFQTGQAPAGIAAIPASYNSAASGQTAAAPKTVTFPNMVTTTETDEPPADEIQEVEDLLKAEGLDIDALDEEGFQTQSLNGSGPLSLAQFLTTLPRRPKAYQVKIPETGVFKLTLKAGNRYQVLDNDASDGAATIQLPSGTLKTWLHLNHRWDKNSQLVVEDPLYYVTDTVTSKKKKWLDLKRWLKLGLRPLPVPADWKSESSADLVLNFDAKKVSGFEMVWLNKKNKQAAFPPGIQEIGPEGGTIELPGVGKLEIGSEAVDQRTVFRMKQVLEAPQQPLMHFDRKVEYISPVVQVMPDIVLKGDLDHESRVAKKGFAKLSLATDTARLGNNSYGILSYIYSPNLINEDGSRPLWEPLYELFPATEPDPENYPDIPWLTGRLGYFARVIRAGVSPEDGLISLPPDGLYSFSTQQTQENVLEKHNFQTLPCRVLESNLNTGKTKEIKNYCHRLFKYYVGLLDSIKAKHYPQLLAGTGFSGVLGSLTASKGFLDVSFNSDETLTTLDGYYSVSNVNYFYRSTTTKFTACYLSPPCSKFT